MIKYRCDYSICRRPELAGSIVLSGDVKAVEGYVMVNFDVASCNTLRDNRERIYFLTLKLAVAPVALTLFVADRK